jgi:hypothetical protein
MDHPRRLLLIGLAVVALAAVTALPVVKNELTQDDQPLIHSDTRIHDLANIREILIEPFWPKGGEIGHHRPAMTLTLALQWAMGNGNRVSYKIVSLTLHAAAALAVLILALELLPVTWAAAAALAFAVHPVHVEAVAVAINQGELIIGMGYALTLAWYIRFRRQRLPTWRDRVALAGVITLATFYKENGVVLPALLLAAEALLIHAEPWRVRWRNLRPTILVQVLAVLLVFVIRSQVLEGSFRGTFTAEGLMDLTMGERALTMLGVVPEYLRLLVWPATLQADYSPNEILTATSWGAEQTLGAAIMALVALLCWRLRRTNPVVVFGFAWMVIALAPVSNVLVASGIVLAERTLLLPSIGVLIALAGLLSASASNLRISERPRLRALMAAAFIAIIAMGASRSWNRYHIWRSQVRLWTQTVIDAPDSYRAWVALGSLIIDPKQVQLAIDFTERGNAIWENPGVMFELAQRYQFRGECLKAIPIFERALTKKEFALGRSQYISCLTWEGRYQEAYDAAMAGIGTGYYFRVFQAWLRFLDPMRESPPPRHTIIWPPDIHKVYTDEKSEPGVYGLYPPVTND